MHRLVVAAAVLVLATACGGEPAPRATPRPDALVVASFDFSESELVAEIYAQALEDEGVAVHRELHLGQRELVLPALRRGLVDVVPEYAGSALDAMRTGSRVDRSDVHEVVEALRAAFEPWGVAVLEPADASNQNVVAVTAALAAEHDLAAVGDLRRLAPSLTVGGPPECPRRPRCLPGLAARYGLDFGDFVPFAGADLVSRALADGVVDVGILFSTDAVLTDAVVVLADDRALQPPDNLVPVVRTAALDDDRVGPALDEVSAALTSANLHFLNWRVANAGTSVAAEAHGWLVRQGLVER